MVEDEDRLIVAGWLAGPEGLQLGAERARQRLQVRYIEGPGQREQPRGPELLAVRCPGLDQ